MWTSKQRQVAGMACRSAGIDDDQRKLILRQFRHAIGTDGEPSSKAAFLTNADYDEFMAIIETHAGGQIPGWAHGHWQARSGDALRRTRHSVQTLFVELVATGKYSRDRLNGWLVKATGGETEPGRMSAAQCHAAINALRYAARRS